MCLLAPQVYLTKLHLTVQASECDKRTDHALEKYSESLSGRPHSRPMSALGQCTFLVFTSLHLIRVLTFLAAPFKFYKQQRKNSSSMSWTREKMSTTNPRVTEFLIALCRRQLFPGKKIRLATTSGFPVKVIRLSRGLRVGLLYHSGQAKLSERLKLHTALARKALIGFHKRWFSTRDPDWGWHATQAPVSLGTGKTSICV